MTRVEHGRVRYQNGVWVAQAAPHVVMRLKRWFPQADSRRRGGVEITDTPEVCRDLEMLLSRFNLKMGPNDSKRLKLGAARHRQNEEEVAAILAGHVPPWGGLDPIREPRDYQLAAAQLAALVRRGLLLGDELGTGKTMSAMLVLADPNMLPALVCVPTHLPRQWVDELAMTFPTLRAHIIRSLSPYDPAVTREMRGQDPDVLIMPYSRVRGWGEHLRGNVRSLLLDEVQEIRTGDVSDRNMAIKQIADAADLVMGMSATPVYNYGGEVWNIYDVLAPGELGSREEFGREWCGGGWGPKARVEDPAALSVYLREKGLLLRRSRKDVGRELPGVTRVTHEIDADRKVYEEHEARAVGLALAILEGDDRQAAFTASGDLDWALRKATGIAKAPYVADFCEMLLEGGEEKLVVFGWHREVYRIWMERLAQFAPVMYTGSESPNQKLISKARFVGGELLEQQRARKGGAMPGKLTESRVLLMSLRSGAGLDGLQGVCRTGVFGELDWSPGMHDQCEGRYDRDGQTDPTASYFLVSPVGTDPLMQEVLQLKLPQGKLLMDPDAELFTQAPDAGARIRRLAEQVLAAHRDKSEKDDFWARFGAGA